VSVSILSNKVEAAVRELKFLQREVTDSQAELVAADIKLKDVTEASVILQEVSRVVQETIHSRLTTVVTRCLQAVFDETYEFDVVFENKRGQTEASFRLKRNGRSMDMMSSCGGGVIDVAAFALRLVCLCMMRKKKRMLVVLDEPFRFLSAEYREKARDLIVVLAAELKVQFIIVTHIPELEIGSIVRIGA
jgi:DNA repair exonuclease SbcCD ATPase subunit